MADENRTGQAQEAFPWPGARRDYSHRLRLQLPSTPQALNRGVDTIMRLVNRTGCADDTRTDLEIAIREALANAIHHGNCCRRGARVFVRCYAAPEHGSWILVRDEGTGFDPAGVPDPRADERLELDHGRGLFLMRALMDRVLYRRGGCEVVLFKDFRGNGR